MVFRFCVSRWLMDGGEGYLDTFELLSVALPTADFKNSFIHSFIYFKLW